MSTKGLKRVVSVKNWELNNIVSSLMFYKEAIKREQDADKREMLQKRLNELKVEIGNYKVA